jgi:hypothetical protein
MSDWLILWKISYRSSRGNDKEYFLASTIEEVISELSKKNCSILKIEKICEYGQIRTLKLIK